MRPPVFVSAAGRGLVTTMEWGLTLYGAVFDFVFVILDGSLCRTGLWGKTSRVCNGWCLWIGTLNCRSAMDLNWQSQEWKWVYSWTGRSQECKGILIWIIADNDAIGLGATRSSCDCWKRLDYQECRGHATSLCLKVGEDVTTWWWHAWKVMRQQIGLVIIYAVANETTGVCWKNGVSNFWITRHYCERE